jgi:cell fate regulator YaaT (PSP1 superfamily)
MYRSVTVEIEQGEQARCYSPPELAIHQGDQCIFETEKMLDFGRIVTVEEKPGELPPRAYPRLLRCATLQDQAQARENRLRSKMAMDSCGVKARDQKLAMRLVRVHFSFDRSVLMVLFSAEERVDFRALVKELSAELHARIEMRQIGVRDEAALIGGLGPCGRAMCCASWLKSFESINVKMAKAQRLSLNPGAISGMCGRLKCCLRYEYDNYVTCGRGMPREGSVVECSDGRGRVIDRNILSRLVKVRLEDERVFDYAVDDVRVVDERRPAGGHRCGHRDQP